MSTDGADPCEVGPIVYGSPSGHSHDVDTRHHAVILVFVRVCERFQLAEQSILLRVAANDCAEASSGASVRVVLENSAYRAADRAGACRSRERDARAPGGHARRRVGLIATMRHD